MAAWCFVPVLALMASAPALAARKRATTPTPAASAAPLEPVVTPAVTLTPEVLTPEGKPRLYPVGGGRESIWQPGMPVYIGDRVVLKLFAATGPAPLKEVRVRVDNQPARTLAEAPWVVEIDTAGWQAGYHFIEVSAQSADPKAPVGSGAVVLFVREPQPVQAPAPRVITKTSAGASEETITEPATAAGSEEAPIAEQQPPAHPGRPVAMRNGVPLYPSGLDVTIHSRSAAAERAIRADQVVTVSAPTLFSVSAGRDARRFIYALTRNGREVFRSNPLPISALVRLQPRVGTDGVGLLPGQLTLWVWAGDAQDNYGAPDAIRVEIAPQS